MTMYGVKTLLSKTESGSSYVTECHTLRPGSSYVTKCHTLSYVTKCHTLRPGSSYVTKCHTLRPGSSYVTKCHTLGPGSSYVTKCHTLGPGSSYVAIIQHQLTTISCPGIYTGIVLIFFFRKRLVISTVMRIMKQIIEVTMAATVTDPCTIWVQFKMKRYTNRNKHEMISVFFTFKELYRIHNPKYQL